MKRFILSTAVISLVCVGVYGQKDAAELARLRRQLGAPETTLITNAAQPSLPLDRPLRVFVSTADDASASQEVLLFIKKINEKPEKYGAIQVVDNLSKATVILVHWELLEKRHDETDNNMTMDPGSNSRIGSGGKSERWISSEVRGYVILMTPERFEILARYERKIRLDEPRKQLSEALLGLLKRQADARKK
jgi:hypothetical protein